MENIKSKEININFSGKLVSLGPLRSDLVPLYNRWNNDFQTTKTLATTGPVILEEEIAAFKQISQNKNFLFFTIYEKHTWDIIYMEALASEFESSAFQNDLH